jgi:ketosteroid isomerase-like protein
MSRENSEIVRGIYLASDGDYVPLFRDEEAWAVTKAANERFFSTDFECTMPLFDSHRTYSGLDGLRCVWLDWMEPWTTYRIEIEEVFDLGERVLLLTRNFGCAEGNDQEVDVAAAALWNVRDGKTSHAEFYFDRGEALAAVGLAE